RPGIGLQPGAVHGPDVRVQQAGLEQLADHEGRAARFAEVVDVGRAVRVHAGDQGGDVGQVGEVLPVEDDARRLRHCDQVDREVGRAAGGVQGGGAVDEGPLGGDVADRGVGV